jgi:hypothetical protein
MQPRAVTLPLHLPRTTVHPLQLHEGLVVSRIPRIQLQLIGNPSDHTMPAPLRPNDPRMTMDPMKIVTIGAQGPMESITIRVLGATSSVSTGPLGATSSVSTGAQGPTKSVSIGVLDPTKSVSMGVLGPTKSV